MCSVLWRMQSRLYRRFVVSEEGPVHHRSIAELRTAFRSRRISITIVRRIDGFIQRPQPTIQLFIAYARNHQQIAGARSRDISHPDAFGPFAQSLLRFVIAQFPGGAAQQTGCAQAFTGIHVTVWIAGRDVGRHIGQNHDREFQPFGRMHGHQPDSFGAFFEHRRFGRFGFLGLRVQFLHESTKRNPTRKLETSREIGHPVNIGEHLVSSGPQRKSGMRSRGFKQRIHGIGDGPSIPSAIQIGQQAQRIGDRFEAGIEILRERPKRLQPSDFVMEAQQQIVGDGKERAFERREDGKFIFGPFNGGERGAQRFHLFAAMKRFRPNQQMRDLAGLQAPNIIASNVFSEVGETAKQQANVSRRDGLKLFRVFRIAHLPATLAYQPFDKRDDRLGQALIDGGARDSHSSVGPRYG